MTDTARARAIEAAEEIGQQFVTGNRSFYTDLEWAADVILKHMEPEQDREVKVVQEIALKLSQIGVAFNFDHAKCECCVEREEPEQDGCAKLEKALGDAIAYLEQGVNLNPSPCMCSKRGQCLAHLRISALKAVLPAPPKKGK
jgi:hypothetical protein